MADLKSIVKNKILDEVIGRRKSCSSEGGRLQWKVLILDDMTLKIISSCLTMSQLASEGVSSAEHIHKHREPNSLAEAIYFVTPNKQNVNDILDDIKCKNYRAFEIMFTETCPTSTLNHLFSRVKSPSLIKSCKQVYLSFIPLETRNLVHGIARGIDAYTMSLKSILPPLETSTSDDPNQSIEEYGNNLMDQMAEKLATLCNTLSGKPSFCFQKDCSYTGPFAHRVSEKFKSIKESGDETAGNSNGNSAADSKLNRYQVLILDRGFDLTSCLVHDMHYQSIAYDILGDDKIEVHKQTYSHTDPNGAISPHQLDYTDGIWEDLKHKHIAEVFEVFPEMVRKDKVKEDARKADEGKIDMKKLKKDVQELTEERKRRKQLAVHTGITDNLSEKIDFLKIPSLCEVEQGLASGGTMSDLFAGGSRQENFNKLIMDKEICQTDKIRLLCIYILSKSGINEKTITSLIGNSQNIEKDTIDLFKNLSYYGCKFGGAEDSNKPLGLQLKNSGYKRRNAINPFPDRIGTQWIPVLKDLIGGIIDNINTI